MKSLLGIVAVILLFGCIRQNNRVATENLNTDTNQKAKTRLTAFPDSLQKKVVGDISFGMSKKRFEKLSYAFQKAHLKNKRYHLGNFQYLNINSQFFHDQLYKVDLYNPWVENEDDLKKMIVGAYDLVAAQYGKPDSTHNGSIIQDVDEDLFVWHIGRKRIKIISGYAFNMSTVTLQFEDVSISNEMQGEDQKRRDSLTKASKKEI